MQMTSNGPAGLERGFDFDQSQGCGTWKRTSRGPAETRNGRKIQHPILPVPISSNKNTEHYTWMFSQEGCLHFQELLAHSSFDEPQLNHRKQITCLSV